jgi:PII-like signaling protein
MAIEGGARLWSSWRFRHGQLHEDHFFELAGELPVEVGFVTSRDEADRFLAHIAAEGLDLFYLRVPVEAGFTGAGGD